MGLNLYIIFRSCFIFIVSLVGRPLTLLIDLDVSDLSELSEATQAAFYTSNERATVSCMGFSGRYCYSVGTLTSMTEDNLIGGWLYMGVKSVTKFLQATGDCTSVCWPCVGVKSVMGFLQATGGCTSISPLLGEGVF